MRPTVGHRHGAATRELLVTFPEPSLDPARVTLPLETIPSLWATGMRVGMTTLSRAPLLGLKRLILPVSYWRAAEFAFAARQLTLAPGGRILDLGSPKDFALFLAIRRSYEVVAVDILSDAVAVSERFAIAQNRAGVGPGYVQSEVQDGRRLTYADNSFDAAYSISVLEHIPLTGDTTALQELVRVVRPGGKIVVTVPYDLEYREVFVSGRVYERDTGERTFFERLYDDATLTSRLLAVDGAHVEQMQLWGEGTIGGERILAACGPARILFSPLEWLLAAGLLRRVYPPNGHAMAAFLTLVKDT